MFIRQVPAGRHPPERFHQDKDVLLYLSFQRCRVNAKSMQTPVVESVVRVMDRRMQRSKTASSEANIDPNPPISEYFRNRNATRTFGDR